jgi:hypothetical protein
LLKACELKALVERIDGALTVLELVIEDLAGVRESLKSLVGEAELPQETTIETVRAMLPQKLRGALSLSEVEGYVVVNVRRRLSPETFKTLAAVAIDRLGGEYVSTREGGYFRMPKKKIALFQKQFSSTISSFSKSK